jgi:hypothetical protein
MFYAKIFAVFHQRRQGSHSLCLQYSAVSQEKDTARGLEVDRTSYDCSPPLRHRNLFHVKQFNEHKIDYYLVFLTQSDLKSGKYHGLFIIPQDRSNALYYGRLSSKRSVLDFSGPVVGLEDFDVSATLRAHCERRKVKGETDPLRSLYNPALISREALASDRAASRGDWRAAIAGPRRSWIADLADMESRASGSPSISPLMTP